MQKNNNEEIKIDKTSENNPFKDTESEMLGEEEKQENDKVVADEKTEVDEVTKIKQDFENLNNQYLRLAADFDNYRKRQEQERESLIYYGKTEAFSKLLEVLDNFDRAEKSLKETEDINCVKEAFDVLHKQITDSFEKMGLSVIETVGKDFDPNLHEAVMQTPTNDYPDQTIIAELQKGYKLGDKVLRPSLVNVATN